MHPDEVPGEYPGEYKQVNRADKYSADGSPGKAWQKLKEGVVQRCRRSGNECAVHQTRDIENFDTQDTLPTI